MDEYRLTELLQLHSGDLPARSRFCPDDEHITRYFEVTLDDSQWTAVKRHLVECGYCLARVGILERLAGAGESKYLPGEVLAEAKSLAVPVSAPRARLSQAWAAAAIVVLAAVSFALFDSRVGSEQAEPVGDKPLVNENARQVRNAEPVAMKPEVLTPLDGESIDSKDLSIEWIGLRGSLHYEVRVLDAEGFIIHSSRVEGATEWKPPVSHLLEPGKSYYVRVDAYLADANSVSSDHVLFSVAGRPR
jgi:hypothetical protein